MRFVFKGVNCTVEQVLRMDCATGTEKMQQFVIRLSAMAD
jgi:hypothetical protein